MIKWKSCLASVLPTMRRAFCRICTGPTVPSATSFPSAGLHLRRYVLKSDRKKRSWEAWIPSLREGRVKEITAWLNEKSTVTEACTIPARRCRGYAAVKFPQRRCCPISIRSMGKFTDFKGSLAFPFSPCYNKVRNEVLPWLLPKPLIKLMTSVIFHRVIGFLLPGKDP